MPGKPKGRKATQKAYTQIDLQTIAHENPAVMKAFGTLIMVLEGLNTQSFETDMTLGGNQYRFIIAKTSAPPKPIIQTK